MLQSFLERLRRVVGGSPRPEAVPDVPAQTVPEETAATDAPEPQLAPEPEVPQEELPQPEPAADAGVAVAEPAGPTAPTTGVVLRLESERGTPTTFEVGRSGATIGRAPENTIRLEDLSVSRTHARIAYRQGAYWLSDLGSMGGTWVDRVRLNAPRRLAIGQVLDIGVCRLTVTFTSDAKPESGARQRPSS